ncbi:unnamed protein product [Phyllotreta striolata]|uniref:Presequence protease, mitochondrial n=1 Tax=Phyllotreta striolata TaxID=444603 RepID=A0A9N9XNK5_PHYSR|nr:unnamed protein product [Phyllotreta striolata]
MWKKVGGNSLASLNVIRRISRGISNIPKRVEISDSTDINLFKPGQKYHGFLAKHVENIPEFRITAVYLIHEKTKAQYLHLYRNDTNNVFSVNFRTTPLASTGLPHILEHTVLCGSERFPVRDPFFKMLNRSLATFMNAMTASDYTMYPFSTQNYSDYRNLQKVYLDAVFKPNLKELDFMQEGWRLEYTDPANAKSNLTIKGVVYNEMKGVFSENENILGQKLQNLLLPDHTYGVISGGDPKDIPNLTWNDLVQFHKEHYHPSNSRIYSYGNFPLLPTLKYVDEEYLSKYEYFPPKHTEVPRQKRWNEPKQQDILCRYDSFGESFNKQNTVSISFLVSDTTNVYETFVMHFLTELLIKGPNSPFYKSLIEPNFSGGYTTSTGFDNQPRDGIFTIGLQNVRKNDFNKFFKIFDDTIDDVIKNGFEPEHIESVLHRYELSVKHETNNFGLNLLFAISPIWNHSDNVLNQLRVNELIGRLRSDLQEDPRFLQNLVEKFLKRNKHRLTLTMSADKEFDAKLAKQEQDLLKQKIKGLSDKDKQMIFEKGLELQAQQNEPAKTELLPILTIEDISSELERVEKVKSSLNNVQTQINKVNANGIVYFKGILNTIDLSPEQHMLLPLFCYVIHKLGTNKMTFKQFDSLVSRKTSGLSFSSYIGESLFHLHTYEPGLLINSYCLEKNVDSMWDIWHQIFTISKLDDLQRFQMLVQLYMSNLTHGIADSGHVYAMQAASGLVSGSAYQMELLSGLHHISYMKRLLNTTHYRGMLDEILNIAKILFNRNKLRVALNISTENEMPILTSYESFVNNLPEACTTTTQNDSTYVTGKVWSPTNSVNCQHHVLNVPVNYCSKAVLTVPYTHPDYAKLRILARLLSSKYLHPELREKQGAYGGGARLAGDGVFSFFSYRDPRNLETLDVFDDSFRWVKTNAEKLTEQDIFEAKLGVFQSVDAPIPPSQKGCEEFLKRVTPDIKQRHRVELLSVNKEDLCKMAEEYLGPKNILNTGKVVIGAKSDKMDVNKRVDELWTVMENVA